MRNYAGIWNALACPLVEARFTLNQQAIYALALAQVFGILTTSGDVTGCSMRKIGVGTMLWKFALSRVFPKVGFHFSAHPLRQYETDGTYGSHTDVAADRQSDSSIGCDIVCVVHLRHDDQLMNFALFVCRQKPIVVLEHHATI